MQAGESSHPRRQATVPDPSRRNCITLEPLRSLGPDALHPPDIQDIRLIRLREVEVTHDTESHEVIVKRADDLFHSAFAEGSDGGPIPQAGTITRAVFSILFVDTPEPATVQISLPDLVTATPSCDRHLLDRWLAQCHFQTDAQPMEMP